MPESKACLMIRSDPGRALIIFQAVMGLLRTTVLKTRFRKTHLKKPRTLASGQKLVRPGSSVWQGGSATREETNIQVCVLRF